MQARVVGYFAFPTRFFVSHSHHLRLLGPIHPKYNHIPRNASTTDLEVPPRGRKGAQNADYRAFLPERATTNRTNKLNDHSAFRVLFLFNHFSPVFS